MGHYINVFGRLDLPYTAGLQRRDEFQAIFAELFGYTLEPDSGVYSTDAGGSSDRFWTFGWRWVRQNGETLVYSGDIRAEHLDRLKTGIADLAAWIASTWQDEEGEPLAQGGGFLIRAIDDVEVPDGCWSVESGRLVTREPPMIPGLGFGA